MTVKQTSQLMDLFTAAYPRYYAGQSDDMRQLALKTWAEMLEEYPVAVVTAAAKSLIATQKFPPAISEVIDKIRLLTQPQGLGEAEAWALVLRATSRAGYCPQEEFDKLPASVQDAVGSAHVLHDWAMTDLDELATVVQSNFMRTYRAKIKAEAEYQAIPAGVRQMLEGAGMGVGIARLEAAG